MGAELAEKSCCAGVGGTGLAAVVLAERSGGTRLGSTGMAAASTELAAASRPCGVTQGERWQLPTGQHGSHKRAAAEPGGARLPLPRDLTKEG